MVQADWANIIGSLSGIPVWIPRLSEKDKRSRHQGISHHTFTPLTQFTYKKSIIPLPTVSSFLLNKVIEQARVLGERHTVEWVDFAGEELLDYCNKKTTIPLTTMGRRYEEDPLFFLGVAAAIYWVITNQT